MASEATGIIIDHKIDRHLAATSFNVGTQPTDVRTPNSIKLRLAMTPPANPHMAIIETTKVTKKAIVLIVQGFDRNKESKTLSKLGSMSSRRLPRALLIDWIDSCAKTTTSARKLGSTVWAENPPGAKQNREICQAHADKAIANKQTIKWEIRHEM